ncbi:MAG TPA: hypothetical protein VGT41_03545 [Candidatus Babeliales bacterium]|nr:hypothetical protein [Candidatus Babeliales bacterium]
MKNRFFVPLVVAVLACNMQMSYAAAYVGGFKTLEDGKVKFVAMTPAIGHFYCYAFDLIGSQDNSLRLHEWYNKSTPEEQRSMLTLIDKDGSNVLTKTICDGTAAQVRGLLSWYNDHLIDVTQFEAREEGERKINLLQLAKKNQDEEVALCLEPLFKGKKGE